MRARQLSFLPPLKRVFDAQLRKGKRKTERPYFAHLPLHVTMRSARARGSRSLLRHKWRVLDLLHRTAKRHRIEIYRFANVGNHLHLLITAKDRMGLRAFLREFAGRVAMLITGSVKG